MSAAFPVFVAETYDKIVTLLKPVIDKASEVMLSFAEKAADLLAQHCPDSVLGQCNAIATISYRLDAAAIIFETLRTHFYRSRTAHIQTQNRMISEIEHFALDEIKSVLLTRRSRISSRSDFIHEVDLTRP